MERSAYPARRRIKTFQQWKADFLRIAAATGLDCHFASLNFLDLYRRYRERELAFQKLERDRAAMARAAEDSDSSDGGQPSSSSTITTTTIPNPSSSNSSTIEGSNGIETKLTVQPKNADTAAPTKDAAVSEPKAPELVKLDPREIGMSVGLKQLFSGKEDKRGRFQWQTTIPEDLGKPAEDAESERWAIIVRNVKVFHDPKKVLSMHSIVIQSPLLKDLLSEVLANYPGVTVDLKRLEFSGRFEPLIHRWSELKAAIAALKQKRDSEQSTKAVTNGVKDDEAEKPVPATNGVAHDKHDAKESKKDVSDSKDCPPAEEATIDKRIEHAELLHDLLVKEFTETIESSLDMKSKGVMTYDLLWTLFQPGSLVYSKQQGQDRVFRLTSSRYGFDRNSNPVFWLMCQYIDYDGSNFGTNKLNMSIASFEGTRSITSLPTLPFDFHGHKDEIHAKLIERGGKVEGYAGSHYRAYHGIGWRMGHMGQKEKYTIKGRIVLDTHGWNRFNPAMAVYVTPLNTKAHSPPSLIFSDPLDDSGFIPPPPIGSGGGGDEDDYDEGYDLEDGGMPSDGFFEDESDEPATQKKPLTDEQKLLCSPLVRGYALKEKLWLNFFVNAVQEIAFNERAFDSLVLPKNQKELILGFTSTQQGYRSQFDDVIEGKGRGIILLLCGECHSFGEHERNKRTNGRC